MTVDEVIGRRTVGELLEMMHYGKLWMVTKIYPTTKKYVCSRLGKSGTNIYANDKEQKTFRVPVELSSGKYQGFRFDLVQQFDIIVEINGEGRYNLIKTGDTLFKGMIRDGKRYKKTDTGASGLPGSELQAENVESTVQPEDS